MHHIYIIKVSLILSIIVFAAICAADNHEQGDMQLTNSEKQELLTDITAILVDNYIFEDIAKKIVTHLNKQFRTGKYVSLTTAVGFTQAIEEDMIEISQDKHLGLVFDPKWAAMQKALQNEDSDEAKAARKKEFETDRLQNFGFLKLEILNGNVGYLDLRLFPDPVYGSETAIAAMNFLANTEAVIIDLRRNGGGWGEMVALICSYFIKDRTELNGIKFRKENKLEQAWTLPYVPGKKLWDKNLYILTSRRTFSAAEDFIYAMKVLGRATIIGEKTKGGAHPIEYFVIQDKYVFIVPNATSVNPITNKNWEGTGIEPDISIDQEKALLEAHRLALDKLLEGETDESKRFSLSWALEGLKRINDPLELEESTLKQYAGQYGERGVIFEGGYLYYIRQIKYKLFPLTETIFMVENMDDFRIQFAKNDSGLFDMVLLFQNGDKYPIKRSRK